MPSLIEDAKKRIAMESFDPVRDLRQAVDRIQQGAVTFGTPMTDGMPDYLRVSRPSPRHAMSDDVLRQGESDPAVRALQEDLNKLGITDGQGRALVADGVFGRNTRDAVENFQLWNGIPTNGIADRDTLAAIRNPLTVSMSPRPGDAADLNTHPEKHRPAASVSPSDSGHPDHAMLEHIRASVRVIDEKNGKSYDDISERISRSLLAACKDNREMYPEARDISLSANALNRVDHVLMGKTGNIFAVEGRIDDPAHKRACVSVAQAAQTSVEQSDQKLLVANEIIAQEQQLAQQRLTRGPDDPGRSGPTMARQ